MQLTSLTKALSLLASPLMTHDPVSLMLDGFTNPAHGSIKTPDDLKGCNVGLSVGGLEESVLGENLRSRVPTLDGIEFVNDVLPIAIDVTTP